MLSHPSPSSPGRRVAAAALALTALAGAPAHAMVGPAEPAAWRAAPGAAPTWERRVDDELRFVYFRDDRSTTMSGSDGDVARARRYRRSGEPLLWFRRDGREYVVRDPHVLREVDDLWEPVSRIGAEQGRIGARQGALGAEQGRHGARQGEIGARQGEIGARQGRVGARQGLIGARLGVLAAREALGVSASERRAIEREREALDRDMRQLDREMAALDEDMRDYDPPTRELGDDMAVLGRRMAALGREMDAASRRADAEMRALVDRAIASGAAQAVR